MTDITYEMAFQAAEIDGLADALAHAGVAFAVTEITAAEWSGRDAGERVAMLTAIIAGEWHSWQREFPDFPVADMPPQLLALPTFIDASWHNDTCPSLRSDAHGYLIRIEYADPSKREIEGSPRFSLFPMDGNDIGSELVETESLDVLLAELADREITG